MMIVAQTTPGNGQGSSNTLPTDAHTTRLYIREEPTIARARVESGKL